MNAPMSRVPASVTGDSSDVSVALEVAGALWEKGDGDEAIRWVRRAGEAADGAGDAARASTLAQAARDLEAAFSGRAEGATSTGASTESAPPAAHAVAASPAPRFGANGRAVRVSVKTSMRDPNLLLLRPLPEGQAPPPGTREGLLTMVDPATESKKPSNGGGAP